MFMRVPWEVCQSVTASSSHRYDKEEVGGIWKGAASVGRAMGVKGVGT